MSENDRNCFGLPILWGRFLESSEDMERLAKELVKDAFESVARNIGHDKARRLFEKVSKKPAKQADHERNQGLLEEYDQEVNVGLHPKSIPGLLAKRRYPKNPRSADTAARQIRRLVTERDEVRAFNAKMNPLRDKMLTPELLEWLAEEKRKMDI